MAVELPNSGNTTLSLPPNTANDLAAMRNYLKRLVGELEKAIGKQFDNTSSVAAEVGGDVDLTTGVVGILPTANGGTGSEEAANAASGVCILDAGGKVAVANLPVGTGANNIVQLNGSSQLPAVDGSLLTGISPTGNSNVLYEWHGTTVTPGADANGFITSADNVDTATAGKKVYLRAKGTTAVTVLVGKFKKISGVSTVTILARLWSHTTDAGYDATLKVDIGGVNNTVVNNDSDTPTWVTAATLNVSSLFNGTTYDITIQLYNQDNAGYTFCSDVMLLGS